LKFPCSSVNAALTNELSGYFNNKTFASAAGCWSEVISRPLICADRCWIENKMDKQMTAHFICLGIAGTPTKK